MIRKKSFFRLSTMFRDGNRFSSPTVLYSLLLLSLIAFSSIVAGCNSSGDDDTAAATTNGTTESQRIYELNAKEGSYTAVTDDKTKTRFNLKLGNLSDILYFTNLDTGDGGYYTVSDLVNTVWQKAFASVEPNTVMQAMTTNQEAIAVVCHLDAPVYNSATGELDFTITYLDGERPVGGLTFTDVRMIISKNADQVQPKEWSTLVAGKYVETEPTATPGIYTLRIDDVSDNLLEFTSAPLRYSNTTNIQRYIASWKTSFSSDPPNASVAYDLAGSTNRGAQVFTLSDPVYEEGTGRLSFTAKRLAGTESIETAGLKANNPSLFIDGRETTSVITHEDNHFSIHYRNSTSQAITVWLMGSQPPCSQDEAANCDAGADPANYSNAWANMKDSFTKSGTHFYIYNQTTGNSTEIDVSNKIDLEPGETLRIIPPLDENNYPQWYYSIGGTVQTAGVNGWVTLKGVDMPAPMQVTLYEYNIDHPDLEIYADISGVDGINTNATMALEGKGCGDDATCGTGVDMPRKVMTNIDAYDGTNDGCPYIMTFNGAATCPNPKHYPTTITDTDIPDWVIGTDNFTTDDVESDYNDIWTAAGSPTGFEMCSAASGDVDPKKAYHIWWSTNGVGQGWLNYLQNNAGGKCDAYGWAYDEKKWKPGDSFDENGNPPDNTTVNPLFKGPMQDDTYINIDITKIMTSN